MKRQHTIKADPGHRLHWIFPDKDNMLHTVPIVAWRVMPNGCRPVTLARPRCDVIAAGVETPDGQIYPYIHDYPDSVPSAYAFASMAVFEEKARMLVDLHKRFERIAS